MNHKSTSIDGQALMFCYGEETEAVINRLFPGEDQEEILIAAIHILDSEAVIDAIKRYKQYLNAEGALTRRKQLTVITGQKNG
jgi:hypothetical protein